MNDKAQLTLTVEQALEQLRTGRQIILVDDEDRENEGDLCMAASCVSAADINFMARYGRGLVCLTMTAERLRRLGLPPMAPQNSSRFGTNFHVSIEAREGVTTGISAADRAQTIRVAVAADARADQLVTPGHVMTLRAADGGVLERCGQTEGSVDLARLAGLEPAGVICEIMRDDGTMARRADLELFASEHGLGILTVAELIRYRLSRESQVEVVAQTTATPAGLTHEFRVLVFRAAASRTQYIALVLGEPKQADSVLVRMHRASLLNDVFGLVRGFGASKNQQALQMIEAEGRGVFVYVLPEQIDLAAQLRGFARYGNFEQHVPEAATVAGFSALREFGLGAQVLVALGLRRVRLMTDNPKRLVGLSGYGLEVIERVSLRDREEIS